MTIVARRRVYWTLFVLALASLVAFVPLYIGLASGRTPSQFLAKAGALTEYRFLGLRIPSHALAAAGIGLCSLFSAMTMGLILYSFRKTVSTEIFLFAWWVLSVGFEIIRLIVFRAAAMGGSVYAQALLTRILLFARYAGYLSLFASGLFAAGFRSEKLGTIGAVILAVSLGLASAMPINTGAFAPTLDLRPGYAAMNMAFYAIASVVTVANFLFAARSTGESSYRSVAMGAALFLIGHGIVISQWNPAWLAAGFALLAAGAWIFTSRLHAYYLWQ
ncbi:MAG: hypothetical protein Q8M76_13120 [Spirochaetaceae bacterium]|nr:hypothetical protein [Spirochaetaceae bacterium]